MFSAEQLRKGLSSMAWRMDYFDFLREVLEVEPREGDTWQMERYQAFQDLTRSMNRFDETNLQRICDYAMEER